MMTLITGFTCPPTIYFRFITKCDKCYYKVRQLFYYKVRWSVITKCDSFFITKCDRCYYKVRQLLQSVTILLQSATGITKYDDYYKVRQYTGVFGVVCLPFPICNLWLPRGNSLKAILCCGLLVRSKNSVFIVSFLNVRSRSFSFQFELISINWWSSYI